MGHGDAGHVGDMDPTRPGMELWLVREGAAANSAGSYLADAVTGKTIWSHKVSEETDVGRGMAVDIDESSLGYEMWSSATDGTYSCTGKKLSSNKGSCNFRIYWDGDLQDELLDGNKIDKWNGNGTTRLFTPTGNSCNGTKSTPNITADLIGDWREEVILHDGASKLYLYTTTTLTTSRLYTLMHDPAYRAGVASEQSSYNQPPHLSFFLGNGAEKAPKPSIYLAGTGITEAHSDNLFSKKKNIDGLLKKVSSRQGFVVNGNRGSCQLAVYDVSGQLIHKGRIRNGIVSLNKLGVAEGIYFVKVNVFDDRGK
jgi:rhamnogalacturonan endolyase